MLAMSLAITKSSINNSPMINCKGKNLKNNKLNILCSLHPVMLRQGFEQNTEQSRGCEGDCSFQEAFIPHQGYNFNEFPLAE